MGKCPICVRSLSSPGLLACCPHSRPATLHINLNGRFSYCSHCSPVATGAAPPAEDEPANGNQPTAMLPGRGARHHSHGHLLPSPTGVSLCSLFESFISLTPTQCQPRTGLMPDTSHQGRMTKYKRLLVRMQWPRAARETASRPVPRAPNTEANQPRAESGWSWE